MNRFRLWLGIGLSMLLVACSQQPSTTATLQVIDQAEAVRADWDSKTPPATGWIPVKLIDFWDARWPHHDGVVWYRLRWNQVDAEMPVGLLVDYVCLADAVYINGSLIHRDAHLTEPLSRSWISPQYFLLDRPLLHPGENTLLVRVSGLAAYQPGFGTVAVGTPEAVQARFQQGVFWRHNVQVFDQSVGMVLGSLFLMLWLLRRKDTVFGWFAFSTLLSAGYNWNYLATDTWPFASTHAWQAFNIALYFSAGVTFMVFLLRYREHRMPRLEGILLAASLLSIVVALLMPETMGSNRSWWAIGGGIIYYAATLAFLWHALRRPRADRLVLAACMLVQVLTSIHDFLLFYGLIRSSVYLLAFTSPLTLIGMGFVLAYRFAVAMRRVEGFNAELQLEVEVATRQLTQTLAREHDLALTNTRIGERLNLVRDLHDGFGGSLLGAIAMLEQSPPSPDAVRTVAALKELRDDLRLVIDTTTHAQDTDLAGLLAPLRHRWSQRLEMAGIDSRWQMEGLVELRLGPARSLDLLRLLQESLTNVLKHSGASRVDVAVRYVDAQLHVGVRDNGRGFDPTRTRLDREGGAGLVSLRQRAARLGSELALDTVVGAGVALTLVLDPTPSGSVQQQPAHP